MTAIKHLSAVCLSVLAVLCLRNPACLAQQHQRVVPPRSIMGDDLPYLGEEIPDELPLLNIENSLYSPTGFLESALKLLQHGEEALKAIQMGAQREVTAEANSSEADDRSGLFGAEQSYEKCLNDSTLFFAALNLNVPWAVQMMDSFGKPSPGAMAGNRQWPGAYEQCVTVRAIAEDGLTNTFSGQYCTLGITFKKDQPLLPGVAGDAGVCVPDSCSNGDAQRVLKQLFTELALPVDVNNIKRCQHEYPLDNLAKAAIVVFGCFGVLIALGTAVDIVLVQMPKWRLARMPTILGAGLDSSGGSSGETKPLLDSKKPTHAEEPGTLSKLLISFSVYTNGSKLLSTHQPAGSLTSVHGIRFYSMTWVVLGHTFSILQSNSDNAGPYRNEVYDDISFQMVANATLSVDTFFVLSGLLVAYLSLKEMDKSKGKVNWPMFYFHRFWRLTPVYMMVIFFNTALQPYLGSGPFWPDRDGSRKACEESWWTNMLYINNFAHLNYKCEGEGWYLANDMQFYMLSPLIFVPFFYSPWLGGIASGAGANQFDEYYIKPYCRMGPYIIGLIAGYILYRYGSKIRMNKIVVAIGWLAATGMALGSLFGLYDASKITDRVPLEVWESALWNAVGRTAWGISIAWVIIACHAGYGGFVNTILSWSALVPLSRLTYCIYLIHMSAQRTLVYSFQKPFYMSSVNIVMFQFALLVMCYLVGAIFSLSFEAPMMGLEKILLHGNKKKA
ncbi:hypothetical protein BaRGS_00011742 [Batillaria attramentaria]|uniref:Nose resistant-to-fluoxetine protein N-terminal domain-containing protein n=1 Tax=Batillaria attramentaria TaxID=370345 RepID=A0ABD0LBP1_9CAEN